MHQWMVGARYELLVPMLGNPAGVIGYCFDQYPDFDDSDEIGVQLIFPNGEYDGFSDHEQKEFLRFIDFDWRYVTYEFQNVIKVYEDYSKNYWRW